MAMEGQSGTSLDPETLFLASKQETGNEWELFKENVKPLKRGRNVSVLNHALKSQTNNHLKASLLQTRRKLVEAIDEYKGTDPLLPWLRCIRWVQEVFPASGDSSGLILIYEQCVRAFWDSARYKDDLRYLRVWLQYAEYCDDAQIIYSFLDDNGIGKSHSEFYMAYALHLESKNKLKSANDIFTLGLSRDAQPLHKLKDAYKKFLIRSTNGSTTKEEDSRESALAVRSFGTVLTGLENRRRHGPSSDLAARGLKPDKAQKASPFAIYEDSNGDAAAPVHEQPKKDPWHNLGRRAERNKENNAIPTKWSLHKIPQKPATTSAASSSIIEVFVDEECSTEAVGSHEGNGKKEANFLQLRQGDSLDIKKEAELLRENPLRNFHGGSNSLPR
ncbi:unnamed protein product [Linum trigynum]|uniref:BUB1 N-terminal domain-containing protein n=1 Tax=Linum trigynum TaxID=586398 RepID=A0AAV2ECG1_9ROSI